MVRPSLFFFYETFPLTQEKLPGLIILSAYYGLASSFTERGIIISEKFKHEEEEEEKEGEEKIIDVTIPVQALVQDGRVYIPGGKGKHNIIGFYVSLLLFQVGCEQGPKEGEEEVGKGRRWGKGEEDERKIMMRCWMLIYGCLLEISQDPCIGEKKKLRVRYLFRGKMHEVTVDDTSPLRAPVRGEFFFEIFSRYYSPSHSRHCVRVCADDWLICYLAHALEV